MKKIKTIKTMFNFVFAIQFYDTTEIVIHPPETLEICAEDAFNIEKNAGKHSCPSRDFNLRSSA